MASPYYYVRDGSVSWGKLRLEDLVALFRRGKLTAETEVRRHGETWMPASQLEELVDLCSGLRG